MKNFNAEAEVKKNIEYLRAFFDKFGDSSKAVIGISGGKDSTVAAAILKKALGAERVIGVMMPNGEQADISDSIKVCETLGIKNMTINIKDIYEAALSTYSLQDQINITPQLKTNLAPRIRMTTLYAAAQGQNATSFVINTCNRSEDYVGYSTKYGDAAGDISVLQDWLVSEVIEVGDYLGMPQELVHKAPSDGLCGKTDEDNLGFRYADLDAWIRYNEEGGRENGQECPIDKELIDKIERKHAANLHKLKTIPSYRRV